MFDLMIIVNHFLLKKSVIKLFQSPTITLATEHKLVTVNVLITGK